MTDDVMRICRGRLVRVSCFEFTDPGLPHNFVHFPHTHYSYAYFSSSKSFLQAHARGVRSRNEAIAMKQGHAFICRTNLRQT